MRGRYQKPIRHVGPEFPSLVSSSARFIPIVQCAGLSLSQLSSRHMFARNRGEQVVVVGMNHRQRLKPVVKVIAGPQGGSSLTSIRVDLGGQVA
jgi:hypothetical protein